MRASSGIVIPAMGDTSDEMLIAIACVAVGYPESPQQSELEVKIAAPILSKSICIKFTTHHKVSTFFHF